MMHVARGKALELLGRLGMFLQYALQTYWGWGLAGCRLLGKGWLAVWHSDIATPETKHRRAVELRHGYGEDHYYHRGGIGSFGVVLGCLVLGTAAVLIMLVVTLADLPPGHLTQLYEEIVQLKALILD